MVGMASEGEKADVVFMDPPRTGSDETFLDSLAKMGPKKVVYISCEPETLARDLKYLKKKEYQAREGWVVDMFGWTQCVESIVILSRK